MVWGTTLPVELGCSTQKANQHIYQPKYICDQNWAKFHSLFLDMVFTKFSVHYLMRPWPLTFWPQKLVSTSTNPNTC